MEKCMHILPMNKLSGAEKMALLICTNLKHYEPIVVCGGDELAELFRKRNIKCYTVDFHSKHFFRVISELRRIISDNDIKLLHCHDNTASFYGYMAKREYHLDVKIISHVHNCYPFLKDGGVNKIIDKRLRNKYDINIACGKLVYDYYIKYGSYINRDKFKVLSNAMDIDEIEGKLNKTKIDIKEKYSIPKDKKIIGFIGRMDQQKGLIPFIEALYKRKNEFEDSVFIIVGNGSQEEQIKEKIKKFELEEKIILAGFDSDIYKYYKAFDIFFLPSKYEGLPMVILEAMAAKVPIISMKVGSIGELLDDGRGILVEAGQYDEFIDKLIELKYDDNLRVGMDNRAFMFLKENYDIKNYVVRLELIYKSFLYQIMCRG